MSEQLPPAPRQLARRIRSDLQKTRQDRIVELRANGATLQAIGDKYGLTRERVRQVLINAGYDSQPLIEARIAATKQRQDAKRAQAATASEDARQKMFNERKKICVKLLAKGLGWKEITSLHPEIHGSQMVMAFPELRRRAYGRRVSHKK